jgi:flagellar assembly factor FliW
MKLQNDFLGEIEYTADDIISFKEGILGFPEHKQYIYVNSPDPEFAFGWLHNVENHDLSFVVTNPFLFKSDYDFDLSESVVDKLGIEKIDEITILSIVVIPEDPEKTTINLKSPVIINNANRKAKQVILDEEYDLKFKIFERGAAE